MADAAAPAAGVFGKADDGHLVVTLRQPPGDAPHGPGKNAGQQ